MFSGGGGFFSMDFKTNINEPVSVNYTYPRPCFGGGYLNRLQISSLAGYFNSIDFWKMQADSISIRTTNPNFTVNTLAKAADIYSSYICLKPGTNNYKLNYSGYICPDCDFSGSLVLRTSYASADMTIQDEVGIISVQSGSDSRDTVRTQYKKNKDYPFSINAIFNEDRGTLRLNILEDSLKNEIPVSWLKDSDGNPGFFTAQYFENISDLVPTASRKVHHFLHQVTEPSPFVVEGDVRNLLLMISLPKGEYHLSWINPELNSIISEDKLVVDKDVLLIKSPDFVFDIVMELRAINLY